MERSYQNSLVSVCQKLHLHGVAFLIVGGAAVGFHGFIRPSMNPFGVESEKPDFDFWYNPTYPNYYRLLNALRDFGVDVSRYEKEKAPKPKSSFFRFELEDCLMDFLPVLQSSINFRDAFSARNVVTFDGVDIPFIGLEHLIREKETNAREKDLPDVEMLSKTKRKT